MEVNSERGSEGKGGGEGGGGVVSVRRSAYPSIFGKKGKYVASSPDFPAFAQPKKAGKSGDEVASRLPFFVLECIRA